MCLKYLADILSEVATWCNHDPTPDPITVVLYGALYNWYVISDARNIANTGWHVMTDPEWTTLTDYLEANGYGYEGSGSDIGKSMATTTNWTVSLVPGNVGYDMATNNSSGLSIPCGGFRFSFNGAFSNMFIGSYYWTATPHATPNFAITRGLAYNLNSLQVSGYGYSGGEYIRLIKDSTTLTHGQTGTYLGNDSKLYSSICIGTQEILAANLSETRYRDGSDIPLVTDGPTWAALITGAMCYYNNDPSYGVS